MALQPAFENARILSRLTRLVQCDAGNTHMLFALAFVPLLGMVGLAIDHGYAILVKQRLQAAMDGAVLAAATASAMQQGTPSTVASAFMADNFTAKFSGLNPTVSASVDANGKVTGSATLQIPTSFSRAIGINSLPVGVASEAVFGAGKAEISLVLDNTASMTGSKLDALKSAAKELVDTVYAAPNAAQKVKVALVPFGQYVNVGTTYRGASWLDVANDSTSTSYQCWDTYPNATYTNCSDVTTTCYNDGTPYSCTYQSCTYNPGAAVNVCDNVTSTTTWNGCVGSRAYPKDVQTAADFSTRVPGLMDTSCPSELARLNNDQNAVKNQIDAMVATGETYIPSGLIWGWRTLSPDQPFADGAPTSQPDVRKFMIVMTDGTNTKSPDYPWHWNTDATLSNQLTAEACTSIKAAGVTIYTVVFGVDDPAGAQLMKDCATSAGNFYSAATGADLSAAFASIGQSLVAIHLTK